MISTQNPTMQPHHHPLPRSKHNEAVMVPDYPLRQGIQQPHPHDILCPSIPSTFEAVASGMPKPNVENSYQNHLGNRQWYMLVAANQNIFESLTNERHKMLLVNSIVEAVRVGQSPPGRFLAQDARTKVWHDVGDMQARQETLSLFLEQQQQLQYDGESDNDGDFSEFDGADTDDDGSFR